MNDEIERYSMMLGEDFTTSSVGDWVLFDDHQRVLSEEWAKWQALNDQLMALKGEHTELERTYDSLLADYELVRRCRDELSTENLRQSQVITNLQNECERLMADLEKRTGELIWQQIEKEKK